MPTGERAASVAFSECDFEEGDLPFLKQLEDGDGVLALFVGSGGGHD